MTTRSGMLWSLALCALALQPTEASAQIKASEHASVSQTIDGTTLTIEYSRPSLRGRDLRTELLGDQIAYGVTWTPGANQATTIESNRDFLLEGVPVPAGRFSVWIAVEDGPWTLVLDPRDDLYHVVHPEPADDQIRIPIETSVATPVVESLAWTFPAVRRDGADLRMQWGDLAVDMTVEIEPTMTVMLTPEEAAPYVGRWAVERLANDYSEAHEFEFDLVRGEDGLLTGEIAFSPEFSVVLGFAMAADQIFRMGSLIDGAYAEADAYSFVEFVLDENGRAVSFEWRSENDDLVARGTRVGR